MSMPPLHARRAPLPRRPQPLSPRAPPLRPRRFDSAGHLALADLGLCRALDGADGAADEVAPAAAAGAAVGDDTAAVPAAAAAAGGSVPAPRRRPMSVVGTPDYIAPEVLSRLGGTSTLKF